MSRLCNNKSHTPSFPVIQKIFRAIKKVDRSAKITDFLGYVKSTRSRIHLVLFNFIKLLLIKMYVHTHYILFFLHY
ncbi:hypothetical protein [Bacillus mycoides]|uniref:hypothetical protein n=1 Tax=Bacillus mycoides TaxID=1405 RepID=UPI003B00E1AC